MLVTLALLHETEPLNSISSPHTEKNNMLYLINKIVATYYKQYY